MATRKRKRSALSLNLQLQCPCCYKPGSPFCDDCEPEDAARKLAGLRKLLDAYSLDAYIVTSQDAHSSEYISNADERRAFLTGFGGSAGTALVTASEALLWTDSRYFLEAEGRLRGTEWKLMKMYQPGVPELTAWVRAHLEGKVVSFDPALVPAELGEEWAKKFGPKVTVRGLQDNLVDAIWTARPDDPCRPIHVHPLEYAGEEVASKLGRVRAALAELGAQAMVLSALDQIAWLFNLRGSDIECNPVFFSYAVVSADSALLFVRPADDGASGLGPEVEAHLSSARVTWRPYRRFFAEAPEALAGKRVLIEKSSCSLAICNLVPPELQIPATSPAERFKAAKNDKEIEGLRRASRRDSLALCQLLASLEERLSKDGDTERTTELAAAELMAQLRLKQPLCLGDSFPTISSSGPNSAVVHYRPDAASCRVLDRGDIYLIDTGGQYKDGTTDITRTVHFGEPTAEQRRYYTRVLQGHLGLAAAVFPEGTPGLMLDTLARQHLWMDGLNYGHGTGHGIGAYLNVHEGPIGIGGGSVPGGTIAGSERMRRVYLAPLEAGNFVSDEPGCYKDGEFGIRIESDLVVQPAKTPFCMGGRSWLCFEYLTLVPFCRELIDTSFLTPREVQWVDEYHARVWEALHGDLAESARDWLFRSTRPLDVKGG